MSKFTRHFYQEALEKKFSKDGSTVIYCGLHKGDYVFGIAPPKDEFGDYPCFGPPYYFICSPDKDHMRSYCGFDLKIEKPTVKTKKA